MRKVVLLTIIVFALKAFSQTPGEGTCWTPDMDTSEFYNLPWFDNNQMLEDFLDSLGYPGGSGGSSSRIINQGIRYWIPVKFWVYRDDNGNGGPNLTQLQNYMDELNTRYNQVNNTQIGFYMKCDPEYINNSTHTVKTFTGAIALMGSNIEEGAINVHVIDAFNDPDATGFALKPLNACMVTRETYIEQENFADLSHEIGHVLGLVHTHHYAHWPAWTGLRKCLVESVSRTRTWPFFNFCGRVRWNKVCESTGDALRDTPADPDLIGNRNCNYVITAGNDEWGDSYDAPPPGDPRPDVTNIMSYNTAPLCVNRFSRLQIAVMLRTIVWEKGYINRSHWSDNRYTFDSFEPDNSEVIARTITAGENQERNFHQQYNNQGGFIPYTTQCDVDWARYTATASGNTTISTAALPGFTNADTRLTIFDANLNQLAQNDNISSTNLYSSITLNLTNGQTYFIRIENLSANTTGYYNLNVCVGANLSGLQISGPTTVCASENYFIPNLPSGVDVAWSASPQNIISLNPNVGPQTTATRNSNGNVTITATLSSCGVPFNINKPIRAGGYNSSDYPITGASTACRNQTLSFSTNTLVGATSYNWFWPSSWTYVSGQGTPFLTVRTTASSTSGTVGVRVANACDGGGSPALKFVQVNSCGGFRFMVAPNPASAEVNVDVKDETENKTAKDATITGITIYDQVGNVKKQQKYGKVKKASLNISDLPAGVYIIEISDGEYKERQQLSVQK